MYVKPPAFPRHIQKALALNRRITDSHQQKHSINKTAINLHSGYKGEESLDFQLRFLPKDDFLIFHYLRIPDDSGHFQLDYLLLSANFFLIIEVKNIHDNVSFDEMGQSYRELTDQVEVFGNPVDQVNLQHRRLLNWLRENKYPTIPIEKIVVYSHNKTYLKNLSNSKIISDSVMHRDKVLSKIDFFIKKHQSKCFNDNQLMDLSYWLLEEHNPEEFGGMKKYSITADQLIKGVICSECGSIPMKWKSGKWLCRNCGFQSHTAHRSALADYALLIGEWVNNRQLREFLCVDSAHIAKRIIKRERLQESGVTSGRRYKIEVLGDEVQRDFAEVYKQNAEVHN